MTVVKVLNGLLLAALLSCLSLDAAADEISIALEESKQVAICKAGDSRCVLNGNQIRRAPTTRQSTGEHSK